MKHVLFSNRNLPFSNSSSYSKIQVPLGLNLWCDSSNRSKESGSIRLIARSISGLHLYLLVFHSPLTAISFIERFAGNHQNFLFPAAHPSVTPSHEKGRISHHLNFSRPSDRDFRLFPKNPPSEVDGLGRHREE